MAETNGLETRVRALEQAFAAHQGESLERQRSIEEYMRRSEKNYDKMALSIDAIEKDLSQIHLLLDRTSTKVGMMIVGSSMIVTAIMSVIHYTSSK